MKSKLFLMGTCVWLVYGCAATFKYINPQSNSYSAVDLKDRAAFAYKYDILSESGNEKYVRRDKKRNIKLVAIKITNYTDSTINIGRDYQFFSNNEPVTILDPLTIKNAIQQPAESYLLYLAICPFLNIK